MNVKGPGQAQETKETEGGNGGSKTDKVSMDRTVERVFMRKLTNELIDVNEGEKEVLNAWNDVVMGFKSVGLKDIPRIVEKFISEKSELLGRLPGNCIIHLCALEQAGLITPQQVLKSVTAVQRAAAARVSAGAEEVAGPEAELSEAGKVLDIIERPESSEEDMETEAAQVAEVPERVSSMLAAGAVEVVAPKVEPGEGWKVPDIIELPDSSDEDVETEFAQVVEVPKRIPSTMAMILSDLGLQSHHPVLARHNVSLEILAIMEDHELRDIGITAFGDRIRMRTAARCSLLMRVNN